MPDEPKEKQPKKKPTPLEVGAVVLEGLAGMFPQGSGGGPSGFPGMSGAIISPVSVPGPVVQQPRMSGGMMGGVPGAAMTGRVQMPGGGVPIAAQPPQYLQQAMVPPQTPFPPLPSGYQTGFEFETKGGRNAAIVQGTIANITQALTQRKQMKEERDRAEAAHWLGQVFDAQQRGDTKMLDVLLTNEKMVNKADKALAHTFPRVPGEPTPPEALALQDALKNQISKGQVVGTVTDMMGRLPRPNTPGGVLLPQPTGREQLDAMTQQALLQAVQEGRVSPEQLMSAVYGPQFALPAEDFKQASRIQFGLEMAPADMAKMDMQTQQALTMAQVEFKKTMAQEIMAYNRMRETLGAEAELTKFVRGSIAGIAKANRDMVERLATAKQKNQFGMMGKEAVENARLLGKLYADTAAKILNSTKDETNPEYLRYLQESERHAKRAEELEMFLQADVDEIINQTFGGGGEQ